MSETLTEVEIPEYPMERAAACPFAPPPRMLEMGKAKGLSRVRIWDKALSPDQVEKAVSEK